MTTEREWQAKIAVLEHYSPLGVPQCPDPLGTHPGWAITDVDILTIDGKETKNKLGIRSVYRKLQKEGYPEGYQVLCLNCQAIQAADNDERPRQYFEMFPPHHHDPEPRGVK